MTHPGDEEMRRGGEVFDSCLTRIERGAMVSDMEAMNMATTEAHEMEKRIRFGSDGNGVYVVVSGDGGRTWRLFDKADDLDRIYDRVGGELFDLPFDEHRAGMAFLRGEWQPWQPLPRAA